MKIENKDRIDELVRRINENKRMMFLMDKSETEEISLGVGGVKILSLGADCSLKNKHIYKQMKDILDYHKSNLLVENNDPLAMLEQL